MNGNRHTEGGPGTHTSCDRIHKGHETRRTGSCSIYGIGQRSRCSRTSLVDGLDNVRAMLMERMDELAQISMPIATIGTRTTLTLNIQASLDG